MVGDFDQVNDVKLPPILKYTEALTKPECNRIPEEVICGVLHRGCKMILSAPRRRENRGLCSNSGYPSLAANTGWESPQYRLPYSTSTLNFFTVYFLNAATKF